MLRDCKTVLILLQAKYNLKINLFLKGNSHVGLHILTKRTIYIKFYIQQINTFNIKSYDEI